MTCLACGSENKPGNRFCGACGVAVRERQSVATACSSCGNINEPNYKFCGKCGAKIERQAVAENGGATAITHEDSPAAELAASSSQKSAPKPIERLPVSSEKMPSGTAPSQKDKADVPDRDLDRPAHAIPEPRRKAVPTTIGGPSFLGLSSDSETAEYLLDDDEGGSGSGRLRVLLAVLLLAGIAGTIFLQVRARYNAAPKSSPLAKPVSADVAPQAESRSSSTTGNAQNNAGAPGPVNNADSDQHPRQPEANGEESKTSGPATSSADTPAKEPDTKKADTKTKKPDIKEDKQTADTEVSRRPASKSDDAKEKLPAETKPSMALVNAQRYLQGKGVRQNCTQGLQYLKTATQQNDPEAAVQMAALYASGHCVRQDRVQAYKWFTSANELQPSNPWIEKNLNWLWAGMTSAERRQISK